MYLLCVWVSDGDRCWHFVYMMQWMGSECTCCLCGLVMGTGVGILCAWYSGWGVSVPVCVWVSGRDRCWHFVYVMQLVGSECTCCLYGLVTGCWHFLCD